MLVVAEAGNMGGVAGVVGVGFDVLLVFEYVAIVVVALAFETAKAAAVEAGFDILLVFEDTAIAVVALAFETAKAVAVWVGAMGSLVVVESEKMAIADLVDACYLFYYSSFLRYQFQKIHQSSPSRCKQILARVQPHQTRIIFPLLP